MLKYRLQTAKAAYPRAKTWRMPLGITAVITGYQATILADGPVWYSRLDAASSPAIDLINGNNAAQTNGPTFASSGLLTSDPTDTAVAFAAASSQYLSAADSAALDVGDVFTMETWIKPASFSDFQSIISKGSNGYQLMVTATGALRLARANVAFICTSTTTMSTGQTYHVVATKNGTTVHLYINGTDVSGAVTNATFTDTTDSLYIGADSQTGVGLREYFNGTIDEVAIYNVALSAATVAAHYAAGIGTTVSNIRVFRNAKRPKSRRIKAFMMQRRLASRMMVHGFPWVSDARGAESTRSVNKVRAVARRRR